jgi:translation initiation factor IF-2
LLLNQARLDLLGVPNPNKISNTGGGFNANRSSRPGFVKGNRPAIVAKVELERKLKNPIRETLEKLQGKKVKVNLKLQNTEEIRDTHRQNLMMNKSY